MTSAVKGQAQDLLDQGRSFQEVGTQLGLKHDTLRKAARAGHLHVAEKERTAVNLGGNRPCPQHRE